MLPTVSLVVLVAAFVAAAWLAGYAGYRLFAGRR